MNSYDYELSVNSLQQQEFNPIQTKISNTMRRNERNAQDEFLPRYQHQPSQLPPTWTAHRIELKITVQLLSCLGKSPFFPLTMFLIILIDMIYS
jgi:hypothetical protein